MIAEPKKSLREQELRAASELVRTNLSDHYLLDSENEAESEQRGLRTTPGQSTTALTTCPLP